MLSQGFEAMTEFWLRVLVATVCVAGASGCGGPRPPNVVLLLVDDLGWRDAGFMGSAFYETPSMDRLAALGMVFTDAYANGPNCAPSRASLMTGLYPPRHGVYTVGDPARGPAALRRLVPVANRTRLDPRLPTIASALSSAGYATASIGKWHLGPDPTAHGFDVNIGGSAAGLPPGGHFSPFALPALPDGPTGEQLSERLTDEAIAFIRDHRRRPFFLCLSHYAVHTPIQARPEEVQRFSSRPPDGGQRNPVYAAMVASVDDSVGRVLSTLDDLGLRQSTVVVLFSDNGGFGPVTSMAPLRGAKGTLYEGGVRVPLVVSWPGTVAGASRSDVAVSGVDLFPTLLDLTGVSASPGRELDGDSLGPLLTADDTLARRAIYWHFPAYLESYRDGDGPFRTTPAGAIRMGDHKLIEFFEDGRLELYDLSQDPSESVNLASTAPETTRELHEALRGWRERVGAPVPTEPNPAYDPTG